MGMKKIMCSVFFASVIAFTTPVLAAEDFSDVPKSHWAYKNIMDLRELGITNGIGDNKFGPERNITKREFILFVGRLLKWGEQETNDYINQRNSPDTPITREEMAVVLVDSLGYAELAGQIPTSRFIDVTDNAGYIALAKAFGIINGVDEQTFVPKANAKREHAAAMMMRMYGRLNDKMNFLNTFYAIKSSGQMDFIDSADSVSYGWSRLELNGSEITLNMTSKNSNEYAMPSGYEQPLAKAEGKTALLMVAVKDEAAPDGTAVAGYIVSDNARSDAAIDLIADALENYGAFDGVVIDIEGMKGEELKNSFNRFLADLRARLGDAKIYVAVHPKPRPGQVYFDAYDFRKIGEVADKVILMAHDYNAKRMSTEEMEQGWVTTPLAPIEQVYYGLDAITDAGTGVQDLSKIMLQINFDTAQWKAGADGKITNQSVFRPDYDALIRRMGMGVSFNYSKRHESPYITFDNAEDASKNTIWYEDSRSVAAKMRLAQMFGIRGLSLWRLGTIPNENSADFNLDVWSTIKSELGR